MISEIRPYQLFSLLGPGPDRRVVELAIPKRRGEGTLTMLETSVLLACCRIVGAERVFEFGTFLGATTLNLALNVPRWGRVYSFDLGRDEAAGVYQHHADAAITSTHFRHEGDLDFMGSSAEARIELLKGNSLTADFGELAGTFDLVFVDGGHDLATVTADTENALKLVNRAKPSAIVWHDYANADYPELGGYLQSLSGELAIHHVGDTMLCFSFLDPGGSLRSL